MVKITLLGSGDTLGTPIVGCTLPASLSSITYRKDKRYRFGMLIEYDGVRVLIDTNPDLKRQCIEFGISLSHIDYILITHTHSDHINGMGEFWKKNNIPCFFGNNSITKSNMSYFQYLENEGVLNFKYFETNVLFEIGNIKVLPIELNHGFPTWGFILYIGDKRIGICSDTNICLSDESKNFLRGCDILYFDGFSEDWSQVARLLYDCNEFKGEKDMQKNRYHSNIQDLCYFQSDLNIKKMITVHMSRYTSIHDDLVKRYENNMFVIGYDGLEILI